MKCIALTLDQVIRFAIPRGEEVLYRDQISAQQCYVATMKTKSATEIVELIEKEREVLEDVVRIPKEKVMEELTKYDLYDPCFDCFFLIGSNLKEKKRAKLIDS